jgi:hypothetical protein
MDYAHVIIIVLLLTILVFSVITYTHEKKCGTKTGMMSPAMKHLAGYLCDADAEKIEMCTAIGQHGMCEADSTVGCVQCPGGQSDFAGSGGCVPVGCVKGLCEPVPPPPAPPAMCSTPEQVKNCIKLGFIGNCDIDPLCATCPKTNQCMPKSCMDKYC